MSLEEEMHPTYFALKWLNVDDRLWTDADTARYVAGDHNAVGMWFGREAAKSISSRFCGTCHQFAGFRLSGPLEMT